MGVSCKVVSTSPEIFIYTSSVYRHSPFFGVTVRVDDGVYTYYDNNPLT